jgi:glucose-1-phosphate thymidylyltransferase
LGAGEGIGPAARDSDEGDTRQAQVIGEGCDIGPNVTIFPSTSIGDNVTIEPYTMIKNSILMSNASIAAHSYLSHCVLGYGVKGKSHLMGAGAEAYVNVGDEFFKVPHMGSIVGEDTEFGTGVIMNREP